MQKNFLSQPIASKTSTISTNTDLQESEITSSISPFKPKNNLLTQINEINPENEIDIDNESNSSDYSQVESIMNNHIIANLNNHTFHFSPNDNNFYFEEFENKFLQNKVV